MLLFVKSLVRLLTKAVGEQKGAKLDELANRSFPAPIRVHERERKKKAKAERREI